MRPPRFWQRSEGQDGGWQAAMLAPLAAPVVWAAARRARRPGWRAPVPVLCCGNATVGGAGKTTVALDLVARLVARGVAVHCLTRGYGGQVRGPLLVRPGEHGAALVGDEPLLLAALAPTWVGADRAASARAAVAAGAEALVMDDGLQNPGLRKSASLLVVDAATGFGNGRVLPAGPLREPVAAVASRCRAAVVIGADAVAGPPGHLPAGLPPGLPPGLPVLAASLQPERDLAGQRVLAFAGIARPGKFYATLRQAGAEVAATVDFPDHHRFVPRDLAMLAARAAALGARPATTPKDATRLPPEWRARALVAGVRLVWRDEAAVAALLGHLMDEAAPG